MWGRKVRMRECGREKQWKSERLSIDRSIEGKKDTSHTKLPNSLVCSTLLCSALLCTNLLLYSTLLYFTLHYSSLYYYALLHYHFHCLFLSLTCLSASTVRLSILHTSPWSKEVSLHNSLHDRPLIQLSTCVCVFVSVCERERCACVCVCVLDRERVCVHSCVCVSY